MCQSSLAETRGHPAVWKQVLREANQPHYPPLSASSNTLSYWWFSSAVAVRSFSCFPRRALLTEQNKQSPTLCWTRAQMGAVSNISDHHWGTLTTNRPLRNSWFIICNGSYALIFPPGVKYPKPTMLCPYQQQHLLQSGPKVTDARFCSLKCFVLFPDEVRFHPVKSFELYQWVYISMWVRKQWWTQW